MTKQIKTGNISDSKAVAVGDGATASVTEIHFPPDGTPAYEAPPLPPSGTLSNVGDLPPGSRPVHGHYPHFTGRQAELLDLAELLLGDDAPTAAAVIAQPTIASGMGGIGKTQLAVEFMYRYGRYFSGGVYWVSFSDPDTIGTEIAACVGALTPTQQATFHTLDLPTQTRAIRAAWQQPTPRLLIFDNLDDKNGVALLNQYCPKTGGCRLLVTSRRDAWPHGLGVAVRPLHTLPRPDSVALLQQLIHPAEGQPEPAAELDHIAAALGDLPLALHLAGSYLHRYHRSVTPVAYLAKLASPELLSHPSLTGKKAEYSPTGHELHVARTFALSYERLDAADPTDGLALALLTRLAYFSSAQVVPLTLLIPSLRSGAFTEMEVDDPDVEDGLSRLSELGLIERGNDSGHRTDSGDGVTLHRLIAAFVHSQPSEGGSQADVEQTIFNQANRINNAGFPRKLLSWQAHLRHVADAAIARESKDAADLSNVLGYHLDDIGAYEKARLYYERAIAISERQYGKNHASSAVYLNNLGSLLKITGEYKAARPLLERALKIWKKALGSDHPQVANGSNNLGNLLQATGDYKAARLYMEQALQIDEKLFGSDHPSVARDLNNLGSLLKATGAYEAALSFLERALQINAKAFGGDHPTVARDLNNLGIVLQATGEYKGARPFLERALQIDEKALGGNHPSVAIRLGNLGGLLQDLGAYEAARPYMERALQIDEKALGGDHPSMAIRLNNLGGLLHATGAYEAARPYMERALQIDERALGGDHPAVARDLNNLGGLLQDLGAYEAAQPYMERALQIDEKALGGDHPAVARDLNNLGSLLQDLGAYEVAQLYMERAVSICEAKLGADHPNTVIVSNNLAALLAKIK